MKITLTTLILLFSFCGYSQDTTNIDTQKIIESQLATKRFVQEQKAASSKYVVGATMYVAATVIQSTNDDAIVPTTILAIIGSVFSISAWIQDRRSYRHLDDSADYMLQSLE